MWYIIRKLDRQKVHTKEAITQEVRETEGIPCNLLPILFH